MPAPVYREEKSKVVAGLLAIFLGGLGIHKFYLGQTGQGVAFLVCSIVSACLWIVLIGILGTFTIGIICLVQGITYLVMSDGAFQAKYGRPI
jgi:TM2 domain-containing membrane protein YozV